MALHSINNNLERLEEQLFSYKSSLKTKEQKENVSKRLREQLLESKAVVKLQRMDAECESLMISLKQRLMLLQDILIPKGKDKTVAHKQKQEKQDVKLNLSSDSSDEETLSSLMTRRREAERRKSKMSKKTNKGKQSSIEAQQLDTSESNDTFLPLALRRQPRERKFSYKSLSSSASSSNSRNNHSSKIQNRQEQTVSTSGVSYHSEEILVEQEEMDDTPTLHIKIPSLHRGNVHYIILDSLDFARKIFDYRANEVKQQQQQQSSITQTTKISKTRKKQIKSVSSAPVLHQLTQQEHELELSQLIQDVMAEACSDETLQATNALENINNNLIDNYESIAQENFITYSQSSQEISYSQNSNLNEKVCSTSNLQKKQRTNKRSNDQHEHSNNEPARKRGRKPKKKNDSDNLQLQSQPPTKTNLAKYVEFFANDCELMSGSTTPAASSTRSQPLVSSTTQNFEVVDQLCQQQEQLTSPKQHQIQQEQQSITYYIDGDWANGGPCQLVPTSGLSVDTRQLNQEDMNAPFQDFVNYIDNSVDSGNNVIARVLEASHSLPISIPLPIANIGLQTKTLQQTHNDQHSLPVINIQLPSLPNNMTNTSAAPPPPPAHNHKEVLDLSIKSKTNYNCFNNNKVLNLNQKSKDVDKICLMTALEDDCLPLDLSKKAGESNITQCTHTVTIDNQDEEFIRCLIEQSEYHYNNDELKKSNADDMIYEQENDKSYKAGLDMPLLDFDANDLADLVDNGIETCNKQKDHMTEKINYTNTTNNDDSNYVSMSAVNSGLNFSDNSTSDIFNKLLNICPDNQFLDNINKEFSTNDDLSESVFEQCIVENSTMLELEKTINEKNPLEMEQNDNICDTSSKTLNDHPDKELSSSSTDTSLAVQLHSSNNISNASDASINLMFSFGKDKNLTDKLENQQETKIIDVRQDSLKSIQCIVKEKEPKDFEAVVNKVKPNELKQTKNLEEHNKSQKNLNTEQEKEFKLRQHSQNDNQRSINKAEQKDFEAVTEKNKPIELKQTKNLKPHKESQRSSKIVQIKNDSSETIKKRKNSDLEIEKHLETNQQKYNKINITQDIKDQSEKEDRRELVPEINCNTPKAKQPTQDLQMDVAMTESLHIPSNTDSKKRKPPLQNMKMDVEITKTLKETSIDCNTKEQEQKNKNKTQDLSSNDKLNVENKKTKGIKTYSNKTKSKENVVFSVAKITLSDDDHLFTTDSDTSSGKSFDINDKISSETNEMKEKSQNKSKNLQQIVKAKKEEPKYSEKQIIPSINAKVADKKAEDSQMVLTSNKPLIYPQNKKSNDEQENSLKSKAKDQLSIQNVPNETASLQQKTEEINNELAINLKSPEKENHNPSQTLKDIESQESFILNLNSPIYQLNEENDSQTLSQENDSCCSEVVNLSITSKHENNSDSYTEDLIILNIDEEDFSSDISQDVQNNKKNENGDRKEQNLEKKKVSDVTKDNDKCCKDLCVNNQQLTLLELESKLEGSLDFDEDYDDTLSLATSCFNSPNDDRFEDSININDSITKSSTSTIPTETAPLVTNVAATLTSSHKDLKHFKIPKITHTSPKENKAVQETNELNTEKPKISENRIPSPTTNQMPKIIINLEKITRTIKNDSVAASSNQNCFDILQPPLQNDTPALRKILEKVFGITCLPFLIDKCYAITHCQQSHQFNNTDTVYQILNTLDKIEVNSSYQLMYNHVKLYKLYFEVFCTYFTYKNDRVKLLNMINDCERYPEYAEFIIAVYESLVKSGLSRVNACRLILKRIRETTINCTIIEALVAIIMKSDWIMFTDIIEKYTQEVYKFNYRITTLEQMAPAVLNSKGPHLKQIFGKCVQTLHPNDTCLLLHSPLLIQCVALLTTNT